MKLAIIGPLPPLRGGIAQYNDSLIRQLQGADADFIAISFRKLYPDFLFPGSSQFDTGTVAPGIEPGRSLLAYNPFTWFKIAHQLKEQGTERVVLHHWHPFFAPCYSYLLRPDFPEGVIIIAHNVLPHEKTGIGKFLNSKLFRRAKLIISGAESERAKLELMKIPSDRIRVVPHPVYDRFLSHSYRMSREEARGRLGIDPDIPFISHLGLVRDYKGIDILIKTLPLLKSERYKTVIAGEFYNGFSEYNAILEEPMKQHLTLRNQYLTDQEFSLYLQASDALVLPYRHATQSGVAMAAMAAGVPVIATRVGALIDVIDENENGILVDPENPHDLAKAIDHFIEHIQDWRAKRTMIAENAAKKFSWAGLADVLLRPL